MIYLLCVFVALIAAFPAPDALQGYTFERFLVDADKSYDADEYALRKQIFSLNLQNIMAHNAQGDWKQTVTQFADMTESEFKAFKGYNHGMALKRGVMGEQRLHQPTGNYSDLPASVDWRNKGVVTPVKNQASCGSCWAFASAETLESHDAIRNGKLQVLSPQQMVDCAPNPNHCGGTGGCEGATAEVAYAYVQGSGLATEATYPYTAKDGTCHTVKPAAGVEYYMRVAINDQDAVAEALANQGPLAVAVDASHWSFYSSGIYDGCAYDKNIEIDHLVQLVGYGTEGGKDYWLIRNSWGESWGEDGFIRIAKDSKAQCGEDKTPLDGSGCNGSPDTVTVCGQCGVLYDVVYPIPAVL